MSIQASDIIVDIFNREATGNVAFVEIYVFHDSTDYHNAANNHTDKLAMGEFIDSTDELKQLSIAEYSIAELTREEYDQSVLANSSVSIDEYWDEDGSDGMRALVVRILVDNDDE